MNYVCGSYEVCFSGQYRDYTDLEAFVCKSGMDGLLLGEDARDFMAFFAVEVKQPFRGVRFRIGIILDNAENAPCIAPIHERGALAIGMNRCLQVVDLGERAVIARFDLDSRFHRILCNGPMLVAIHELGASVIQLGKFRETAAPHCEVVADAELSHDILMLTSMDGETTIVELGASS